MEPRGRMYQVVTQVNVLSSVMYDVIEVDALILVENEMEVSEKAS